MYHHTAVTIFAPTKDTHRPACFRPRRTGVWTTVTAATVVLSSTLGLGFSLPVRAGTADEDKEGKKIVEKKPEPRVKFTGLIEAGITVATNHPTDKQNFGRLFDDREAEPLLNQATFTVERALVPEPGKYDFGFKLQVTGGSDARFLKTIGLFDNIDNNRHSFALVEAYASLHAPWLTEGGFDFKIGQFVTLEGSEVIYPTGNYLYSHNYIFNFGIPLQHLGLLTTFHATKVVDFYAGITRGSNTSLTDNNHRPAFHGGFGLNLLDGKIAFLATTHIGPENALRAEQFLPGLRADEDLRYYNNFVLTWKITDKLTSVTDAVYTLDEYANGQECYGVSQLFVYNIHPKLALVGRAEFFRDDNGFFVAQFAKNDDFVNLQRGDFNNLDRRTVGGGATNYSEFTVGVNIKPNDHILIRPEVRYDKALDGHKAFDDSSKSYSFTGAVDVIFTF